MGLPAALVCLRGQIPIIAWGAPYGEGGAPLVGIRPGRCAQGSAENSARPMSGSAVASRKRAPAPRSAEPSSALRQPLLPAHATTSFKKGATAESVVSVAGGNRGRSHPHKWGPCFLLIPPSSKYSPPKTHVQAGGVSRRRRPPDLLPAIPVQRG